MDADICDIGSHHELFFITYDNHNDALGYANVASLSNSYVLLGGNWTIAGDSEAENWTALASALNAVLSGSKLP